MKCIQLTQHQFAIIDDEDYDTLCKFKWRVKEESNTMYAIRDNRKTTVRMHRQILNIIDSNYNVDHINGNGLDNRKCNLRVCTQAQNVCNTKPRQGTSSKFKGVSWNPQKNKFHAYVNFNKKRFFLGYYNSETEAAKAYNQKASELFGEFARLNKVS